jgi:hypothetical protein
MIWEKRQPFQGRHALNTARQDNAQHERQMNRSFGIRSVEIGYNVVNRIAASAKATPTIPARVYRPFRSGPSSAGSYASGLFSCNPIRKPGSCGLCNSAKTFLSITPDPSRASFMNLVNIPQNPVPALAEVGRMATRDGIGIRYALFPATGRPLKGTIVLLTGRNEFIEKYFETIGNLTANGFAVAAMDWRGQGGSGPHAEGSPARLCETL